MSEEKQAAPENRSFKYQVWIMLLMVAVVMVAGFLMMPQTEEQREKLISLLGTTNQGELVKPAVAVSAVLPAEMPDVAAKWKVVIVAGGDCDSGCEKMLYDTRQVHIRIGKDSRRIKRILLSGREIGSERLEKLEKDNPYLTVHPLQKSVLMESLRGTSAEWDMLESRYFVVTPDNKAILYYTKDHESGGLLEDLKHLLKYSPNR